MFDPNRITYFAETDARNRRIKFGIKAKDRTRHVYVIGKTGMGKSTLLENMAVQDLKNGEGMAFIDPHGKTAELLLEYVPKDRIKDVLYFAPFDSEYPVSFNVMEDIGADKRHLVVSGLMSAFKKIWLDAWSARMEYILSNTLLALLEYPNSTLLGVNRMLSDKEFRKDVVSHVTDPTVKTFWNKEFAGYTERMAAEAVPAIQNKVGQFLANPLVRNLIGQPKSSFDIRKFMDERKILIINLSKGKVGEQNANLIGSMLITKIYLAAMSRADVAPAQMEAMPNFYFYVDEFQSFANESFANILSEARKYHLNLTIAHQYIEQMSEEVRAAVFGNVGTMIAFRVGSYDAEVLEKEFAPTFTAEDLVNLGFAQIYLKLMIDGIGSQPFSAVTMPPIKREDESYMEEIISNSRAVFARPRNVVEDEIIKMQGIQAKSGDTSKNAEKQSGGSARGRGGEKENRPDLRPAQGGGDRQDVSVEKPKVQEQAIPNVKSDNQVGTTATISNKIIQDGRPIQETKTQSVAPAITPKTNPVSSPSAVNIATTPKLAPVQKQDQNALRKALQSILNDPRLKKQSMADEIKTDTKITEVKTRDTLPSGDLTQQNKNNNSTVPPTNKSTPNHENTKGATVHKKEDEVALNVSPKIMVNENASSRTEKNFDEQKQKIEPKQNDGLSPHTKNTQNNITTKKIVNANEKTDLQFQSKESGTLHIHVTTDGAKSENKQNAGDGLAVPEKKDELKEVPEDVLRKIFKE